STMSERFLRGKPHLAFAVTVEVVFSLIGKKFDRPDIAATALQGLLDGEIGELAVERRGLATQLTGRMRVGVRGEAVPVEERHAPVHRPGGPSGPFTTAPIHPHTSLPIHTS